MSKIKFIDFIYAASSVIISCGFWIYFHEKSFLLIDKSNFEYFAEYLSYSLSAGSLFLLCIKEKPNEILKGVLMFQFSLSFSFVFFIFTLQKT